MLKQLIKEYGAFPSLGNACRVLRYRQNHPIKAYWSRLFLNELEASLELGAVHHFAYAPVTACVDAIQYAKAQGF